MYKSMHSKEEKGDIYVLYGAILAAGVFLVDIFFPLGVAGAVPYAIVILVSLWMPSDKYTVWSGVITTGLTVSGYFLKPGGTVDPYVIYINRSIAILGIWTAVYFVGEYRKSRNEIRKSSEIQAALFEFATEGIIVSDYKGMMVSVNPETEKMFGYGKGELIGKPVELLVPRKVTAHHSKLRGNYYHNPSPRVMGMGRDLFGMKKDGTEFPVEISLSGFELKEGKFVIAFIIDITERKKHENALKNTHKELQNLTSALEISNQDLEQFAYVASHDLQEPLRKIQSFGERLASKEKEVLSDQGKDYVERMQNAAQRMQSLINDLLTFSRVTTRAQSFASVDLNEVIRGVLSDMEVTIEKTGAAIEITRLPVIEAEPTQMRQLFQNLLSNACKFQKGNTPPHIKITMRESTEKNSIDISIEDNGIGFNEKYIDKIFNIFQRLEGAKYEGSGIGLAVCKKIVTRHGGKISAASKPGEGTRFVISLPVKHK